MAYSELRIVDNICINHQKRTLLTPFFIVSLLNEAKLFPQSPKFASNILRFGEEPGKLMKMLSEPNNTILLSGLVTHHTKGIHPQSPINLTIPRRDNYHFKDVYPISHAWSPTSPRVVTDHPSNSQTTNNWSLTLAQPSLYLFF